MWAFAGVGVVTGRGTTVGDLLLEDARYLRSSLCRPILSITHFPHPNVRSFMWLFLLVALAALALFVWNRKQAAQPRNRWNRFWAERHDQTHDS